MDLFTENVTSIYELINEDSNKKQFINLKMVSKQYLAYYLYRIISKFFNLFQTTASGEDIKELFEKLKIPEDFDPKMAYPLAGKMVNDEEILELIILIEINIFNTTKDFLEANETYARKQANFIRFVTQKDLNTIIRDLVDLQKLLPGLSVSAVRPNYLNNNTKV